MNELHVGFRTTVSLSCRKYAERFYDNFNAWKWPPQRFDRCEPICKPWASRDAFIETWLEEGKTYFGQVLVHRGGVFPYYSGPIMLFGPKATCHVVTVYGIPESECTEERLAHIIRLTDQLFVELDLDYGRICLSEEYEAKNIIKDYRDSRGRIEPRHVIGVKEWPSCLPGIYWTNYYGRKYFEQGFGRDINEREIFRTTAVGKGGMRVQLGERPDYFRHAGAKAIEEAALQALGRDWFFERHRMKECTPLNAPFEHLRHPNTSSHD